MQIDFFGANCIRVKTKTTSVVFDDNLKALGKKTVTTDQDVAVGSNTDIIPLPDKGRASFYMPGEYEVGDIMFSGVAAQSHIKEKGDVSATIFRGVAEDIKFVVLGHIIGELTDVQLEAIGVVDVVFVPVGGNGYTLDEIEATKLVKQLDPKMVIPTHYQDSSLNYEMPQNSYDEFIKLMNVEPEKKQSGFKIKKSDLSETVQVVIVE